MPLSKEAFHRAIREEGPYLRRYLRVACRGSDADADDLLQRTFLLAWRRLDTFEGGSVRAWLKAIARYEHRTHRRSWAREQRLKGALSFLEASVLASLPVEETALPERLSACLEHLPERERHLVRLRYPAPQDGTDHGAPERSWEEIAAVVGRSPQSLRVAWFRTKGKLLTCIAEGGEAAHSSEGGRDGQRC